MVKVLNIYQTVEQYKQKHGIETSIIKRDTGEVFAQFQALALVVNNKCCPQVVPLQFDAVKQKFTVPRGYK